MSAIALPKVLEKFAGRISDLDSHEMMPAQEWVRHFGPDVQSLVDAWTVRGEDDRYDKNHPNVPDYPGDIAEIGPDVLNFKGCRAPGAVDIHRRLQVMDAMGAHRQLMFPTGVGFYGMFMLALGEYGVEYGYLPGIKGDREAIAKRWISLYNEWAIGAAKISERIRPVLPVYGDSVDELVTCARHLIDNGIRAVWLQAGKLPGGKSPAHSDLDPFWRLLAESNCVATLHPGAEGKFFESPDWGTAPAFEGHRSLSEFKLDPWSMSVLYLPSQNFLATMINGGVFARHPSLRFGVIEAAGFWVGPMMEMLDLWYTNLTMVAPPAAYKLPELPSSYLKRYVRVSVFPFEPIDTYIERYGLEDVMCFSTDYPHVEGGKDTFMTMYKKVERLGPHIVEKFFVKNGQWLLPE